MKVPKSVLPPLDTKDAKDAHDALTVRAVALNVVALNVPQDAVIVLRNDFLLVALKRASDAFSCFEVSFVTDPEKVAMLAKIATTLTFACDRIPEKAASEAPTAREVKRPTVPEKEASDAAQALNVRRDAPALIVAIDPAMLLDVKRATEPLKAAVDADTLRPKLLAQDPENVPRDAEAVFNVLRTVFPDSNASELAQIRAAWRTAPALISGKEAFLIARVDRVAVAEKTASDAGTDCCTHVAFIVIE